MGSEHTVHLTGKAYCDIKKETHKYKSLASDIINTATVSDDKTSLQFDSNKINEILKSTTEYKRRMKREQK